MRVALFFDGKNFYSGLKDRAPDQIIDFSKMSNWLVERIHGTHLWGAYYYTGVESTGASASGQTKLSGFLDMLEMQPGFFVKRFPRKIHTYTCTNCGSPNRFVTEKEIDTTMASDMLRLAAVDAFDVLILMSGDADHTPAIEGVRAIGKQAFVATWGRTGLSSRIRRAAFDHIDLLEGLGEFSQPTGEHYDQNNYLPADGDEPGTEEDDYSAYDEDQDSYNNQEGSPEDMFIMELKKAQSTFHTGYVGMNYFLKRWQSDHLVGDADERRHIMDQLITQNRVEVYNADDGNKAIHTLESDEAEYEDEDYDDSEDPDSDEYEEEENKEADDYESDEA